MKKSCIGIFVAMAILAGCEQGPKTEPTEAFFADAEGSSSRLKALLDAEAQRGAAADMTLYEAHFTGATLNALGLAKLGAIINSAHEPFVVYVDATGPSASARQQAVSDYLRRDGSASYPYRVELGVDPRSPHAVAKDLARMPKTESGSVGNTSGTPAPAGGTPNFSDPMSPPPGLGSQSQK